MYKVKINASFNVDQVLEIYMAEKWWKCSKNAKEVLSKAFKKTYAYACLYYGRRLVGVGRVSSDGLSDAYIHDVAVIKAHRGRGGGKKIVNALLKHLKSKGVDWIVLIANPGTTGFWEGLGFSRMKRYAPMRYKQKVRDSGS